MMSNKWAFSLTSLITIIALAFVVSPAMAQDFDAKFSVVKVSAKSDHNAIYGKDIIVTLTFGAQVDGTAAPLTIFVEDKSGSQTSVTAPDISKKDLDTVTSGVQNDNKVFTFTIPADQTDKGDAKVHLHIAEGKVTEIVPVGSSKKNSEGKLTIDLVGPDEEGPQVLSIVHAPGVIIPAAGYTGATIDVIITLSEAPKEFKAAHINITDTATVADPVALDPIAERSINIENITTELQAQNIITQAPKKRGLYDTSSAANDGIHFALKGDPSATPAVPPNADLTAAYTAYSTAYTALTVSSDAGSITVPAALTPTAIADLPQNAPTAFTYSIPVYRPFTKFSIIIGATSVESSNLSVTIPDADADDPDKVEAAFKKAEEVSGVQDRTTDPGEPPNPGDYITTGQAAYSYALRLYTVRKNEYNKYKAEKALYDAYTAAVMAEQKKDLDKIDQYYQITYGQGVVQRGTGYDEMLHPYLVKITPKYENKDPIVVKVKEWEEQLLPAPGSSARKYTPPLTDPGYKEGVDKLTIKIGKEDLTAKTGGIEVIIPKDKRIPNGGYLIIATNNGDSGIKVPAGSDKDEPKPHERTPAQLLYNAVQVGLPNLETFLLNGGTIDVIAPENVIISEIMWGSDASVNPNNNSQWIELKNNSGKSLLTGDKTYKLMFYAPNETLPAVSTVKDRVGTVGAGGYWSVAGKGQSGRSGVGEDPTTQAAVVPTLELISMQRVVVDGTDDGTMAASWAPSSAPALNFDVAKEGERIGSPGAAPVAYPVAPTPAPKPVTVPSAEAGDIMITEIMVDTGDGRLPQWIELTNVSGAEKNLAGWSVDIKNSAADIDVVGTSVSINLSGTLGVGGGTGAGGTLGKTLLLVAWDGRNSRNLEGSKRIVDVSSQVGETGRYKLISDMAFMIALVPPQKTSVLKYDDKAGNLDAKTAWDIPMDETGRSSLIRRDMLADGTKTMGTAANGWVLASSTGLVDTPATWYGSDEDAGTPGVVGGGPLPVELSHFRPARDKATGAVVITWATQSELNNAGFFIKRSNQKDGEFKVINATMIAGAGTTSEKQFYTYTDTTAQPNVVYYYQIEDVSLDGNRQTLTRGTRLKGHIGAAGKATVTWGELKTSNE